MTHINFMPHNYSFKPVVSLFNSSYILKTLISLSGKFHLWLMGCKNEKMKNERRGEKMRFLVFFHRHGN